MSEIEILEELKAMVAEEPRFSHVGQSYKVLGLAPNSEDQWEVMPTITASNGFARFKPKISVLNTELLYKHMIEHRGRVNMRDMSTIGFRTSSRGNKHMSKIERARMKTARIATSVSKQPTTKKTDYRGHIANWLTKQQPQQQIA